MELELGGSAYRTSKLDAFKQLHVSRKLAPAMMAFGKSAEGLRTLIDTLKLLPKEGEEAAPPPEGISDKMFAAFSPLMDTIASMPDSEVDYIVGTCLSVVERKQGEGWVKIRNPNGRMQFDDIDMPTMLRLTMAVIQENLGRFFQTPSAE